MGPEKKKITLLERFEKHASSKAEAKRVYNIVKDVPFMEMTLVQLLYLKGIGRNAACLVIEVASDIVGKK